MENASIVHAWYHPLEIILIEPESNVGMDDAFVVGMVEASAVGMDDALAVGMLEALAVGLTLGESVLIR